MITTPSNVAPNYREGRWLLSPPNKDDTDASRTSGMFFSFTELTIK